MEQVKQGRLARQKYRQARLAEQPARVRLLGLAPQRLQARASPSFERFCPVCWVDEGRLRTFSDHSFAVAFQRAFFCLCSEAHLTYFESTPEKYTAADVKALPAEPLRAYRVPFLDCQRVRAENCSLQGFCPVSLRLGEARGQLQLQPGAPACLVLYRDCLFRCKDEWACAAFIEQPETFFAVALPRQPPPVAPGASNPLQFARLGNMVAYLESAASSLLTQALASVDGTRVKHPHVGVSSSVIIYLSLYLKANNPNSPRFVCDKYRRKLEAFLNECNVVPELAQLVKLNVGNEREKELSTQYDEIRREIQSKSAQGYFSKYNR